MYINLGECEVETLGAFSRSVSPFRSTTPRTKTKITGGYRPLERSAFLRNASGSRTYSAGSMITRTPSLYGLRNLPALGDYEYGDENLGKFKLKNVVKSVTKAATQVAKVAVKPAALVAGSSLQAVGLRSAANKMGKAVGLTEAERKLTKYGGTAIQAAAITAGAIAAAPYAGAALTAAGKGAVIGGKYIAGKAIAAKGILSQGIPLLKNILGGKQQTATGEEIVAPSPESSATADAISQALQTYGSIPGVTAPADAGGQAAPSVYQAGVTPGETPAAEAPNPLTEASMFGNVSPKMLLIGGGLSLAFFLATRKKGRGRR